MTGGCGFIGSNFVSYMLKKYADVEIINLDSLTYAGNLDNLKEIEQYKRYSFIKGDITVRKDVETALKNADVVVHFAAESDVDRSIEKAEVFIKTNVTGTHLLLECSRKLEIAKFVHVSTDEVYGDVINGRSDEKFPYNPSSPYSSSKASADHLVKAYIRTYKISAVISNCCNNYGPSQFPEKLIPKMIFNIINNKPLPIYGRGKNSREWMHVQDHCEALLLIFLKGKIGENYNIGSGMNLKNIDIAKKLLKIAKNKSLENINKAKIKFVKDRPGHDFRYALNNKKIMAYHRLVKAVY